MGPNPTLFTSYIKDFVGLLIKYFRFWYWALSGVKFSFNYYNTYEDISCWVPGWVFEKFISSFLSLSFLSFFNFFLSFLFFSFLFFLSFLSSLSLGGPPLAPRAPGHCPPMPPSCYATASYILSNLL